MNVQIMSKLMSKPRCMLSQKCVHCWCRNRCHISGKLWLLHSRFYRFIPHCHIIPTLNGTMKKATCIVCCFSFVNLFQYPLLCLFGEGPIEPGVAWIKLINKLHINIWSEPYQWIFLRNSYTVFSLITVHGFQNNCNWRKMSAHTPQKIDYVCG